MSISLRLPTQRTFAWVALSYLLVIVALAIPRVIGSSWRSIMSPRDMRNLEGYPVQWEAFLILRSHQTISSQQVPEDLIEWYSTDEYRAAFPTYLAAFTSQITGSYVFGVTVSEVVGWWSGAVAVFALARTFFPNPTAYCAGILTCASPLGVGHIGAAHLHTASSLSLSVFLVIAWRILHDDRIAFVPKTAFYGVCLYLSSITYTYQWFLAPFFVVVAVLPTFSRRRVYISILGVVFFLTLRLVSYGILAFGGLEVHTHQNDPIRVIISRIFIETTLEGALFASLWALGLAKATTIFHGTISSYHEIIVGSAVVGFATARDSRLVVAASTAVILACVFGAIYDIAWVLMTGYPFVYPLAAHGMASASRAFAARLPYLRHFPRTPAALLIVCAGVAVALTNLDLVGDATFAIGWWRWWYTPH